MKEKNKDISSKTPGGISKSLLTPCRRVGLSRKWKGASPSFISPLVGSQTPILEVKQEPKESRKRKKRNEEENDDLGEEKLCTPIEENENYLEIEQTDLPSKNENSDIVGTPVRHLEPLARKKSKLIANLRKKRSKENLQNVNEEPVKSLETKEDLDKECENNEKTDDKPDKVSTPVRSKSKVKNRKTKSPLVTAKIKQDICTPSIEKQEPYISSTNTDIIQPIQTENKQKSPKELTKECIVVIQKKIFKIDKNKSKTLENKIEIKNPVSQTLFDSDTDDVPLSHFNKNEERKKDDFSENPETEILKNKETKIDPNIIMIDDDSDFISTPNNKVECKLKQKVQPKSNTKDQKKKSLLRNPVPVDSKPLSQSSNSFDDDDDDFDFGNKKTILIRKAYEKPSRPLKAKSTGSITQKDIDDLKARIEMKKKLLLAKAMCKDTEDLRGLIKKWQKGCQDALMELMELMKNKFPDRQNMDYSEMLRMLKIPPTLVGYDSENELFCTPNDASIILSKFNDF